MEKHGKNICDGAGNIPPHIFKNAIKNGADMPPGPREAVVFMARSHPTPTVSKEKKHGWWAFGRLFFGHFQPDLFTNAAVPKAEGFEGSNQRAQQSRGVGC